MYWISPILAVGPYPFGAGAARLTREGVTHVLNVAEGRGKLDPAPFVEVAWHQVIDLRRIPTETAAACLETLHRFVTTPGARVFVHCVAGQNRSPTILWLYLIACGLSPEEAGDRISAASIDALPGHPKLVDPDLVAWAQAWGAERCRAHPRPEVLDPPA